VPSPFGLSLSKPCRRSDGLNARAASPVTVNNVSPGCIGTDFSCNGRLHMG
jgi:hypothetical protein